MIISWFMLKERSPRVIMPYDKVKRSLIAKRAGCFLTLDGCLNVISFFAASQVSAFDETDVDDQPNQWCA